MTAPSISANDSTTAGLWNFSRSNDWVSRYPSCSNKSSRTAPLNIDTSKISPCNSLCRLSLNYQPTTCSISMINNIPTVTFSPNCIIKFKSEFLYLRKMTIHYTSMHTINDTYSDLEILLYHNRNPVSDSDGGVILCILLQVGNDYGPANVFMNEFINQMPSNDMPVEKDIDVSDSWSPQQLFPSSKSFFYYDGALPYPPCTPKWTFIIFEELVPISLNIIDTVKYILGPTNKNVRPIQRTPKGTVIFYNANTQFDDTQDISDSAVDAATLPTIPSISALNSTSWLKTNIYYIKGIILSIILVLLIYVAIRFAKIIVSNDILNNFIIRQITKKSQRETADQQQQYDQQQAEQYEGQLPSSKSIPANSATFAY